VGIALIPVLIGIPILLIKSTETWSASIEEDHRKVQVRVTGRILPFVMVQLTDALAAAPSVVPAAASNRPTATLGAIDLVSTPSIVAESHLSVGTPPSEPPLVPLLIDPAAIGVPDSLLGAVEAPRQAVGDVTNRSPSTVPCDDNQVADHTVLRSSVARLPGAKPVPEVLVVQFDTGERVPLGATLLVGRDPDPGDEFESAEKLAIDDEAMSVSKTHLVLRLQNGKPEVMDLGSTNGTEIVAEDGKLTQLEVRRAVAIDPGSVVKFGDRSFVLSSADRESAGG
jgi:hypothetical protein